MLTELRGKTDEGQNCNKGKENIRKQQTEITDLKNTVTKLKNTTEGFNRRLEEWKKVLANSKAEQWNSSNQRSTKGKKRIQKSEDNLRDLRDSIKQTNLCIVGVSEGKEEGHKTYLNKWLKLPLPREENKYPDPGNQGKKKKKKINPKRPTPRHMKTKVTQQAGDLKSSKRKATFYTQGIPQPHPARFISRYLSRNSTGQREIDRQDIFKMLKGKTAK